MLAQSEFAGNGDPLESTSLVELVARRLRSEILSGTLVPGERLIEEQLTRRFGTSRAPLREALRLLGQQGLVEHLPRRGVRVTQLSERDMDELFGLRDVLERFAVRLALPLRDRRGLALLEARLADMERAVIAGATLERAEAHRQFHIGLAALAEHRHLLTVYEPVILKLQLCIAANLRREAEQRSPLEGVRRHRRLLDAIATGNVDEVLTELASHGARTYIG
ncbi:MAG TPA: GntR family transcriptional regulator [Pseudonocardiaceae bacterium]